MAEDCEKTKQRTLWNSAIIPFVPPERNEDLGKDEYLELTLRVNRANMSTGASNVVKKKLRIMKHGPIEELFLWKQDVLDAIRRKPCLSAQSKFEMAEMLLAGDPLASWKEYKRGECEAVQVEEGEARGETQETFESTMRRFFAHHFPRAVNSARRQTQYLRTLLRKPRSVSIHTFILRLKQLNRYLPFFPEPDNVELDEATLVEVVIGVIPLKWKTELVREKYDVGAKTLQEVETRLEMLEVSEALEKASLGKNFPDPVKIKMDRNIGPQMRTKSKIKPSGSVKIGRRGKFKKQAEDESDDNPLCKLCTMFGGNPDSHSTNKCFKKEKKFKTVETALK